MSDDEEPALTAEHIARYYAAMLDSVNLINSLAPTADTEALKTLDRNVRHLEIMLVRNWWNGYDLAPIRAAIVAGKQ